MFPDNSLALKPHSPRCLLCTIHGTGPRNPNTPPAARYDGGMKLPQLHPSRLIAGILAIGGCSWGILFLPLLVRKNVSPLAIMVFGPGYLVTFGYLVRLFGTPPLAWRYLIWISSLVVQGAWIVWMIAAGGLGQIFKEPPIPVAWWIGSVILTAVALAYESPKGGD